MKKFLPILFFLASIGFADSKSDTTIVPKKAGGSVIISGGTGKVLVKGLILADGTIEFYNSANWNTGQTQCGFLRCQITYIIAR
jgi:hypothetical protein